MAKNDRRSLVAALLATSAMVLPGAALAIPTPPPLPPGVSDILTVYNGDGIIVDQVIQLEDGTETGDPLDPLNGVMLSLTPGRDIGLPQDYMRILEPDGSVSDIFGVAFTSDAACTTASGSATNCGVLAFLSDAENTGVVGFDTGSVPDVTETGDPINVSVFLAPVLLQQRYTAFFQSDVDVPEPVTLSLFGAGLAGAVAIRRRRKTDKRE